MTAGIVLCFAMILQLTTTFHGLYERFFMGYHVDLDCFNVWKG